MRQTQIVSTVKSGNRIFNVSYGAFEKLLQIQTLDLSHNKLRYIRPGALLGLVALRNLDLSHNMLQRLQNRTHGLLEDCLSIKNVSKKSLCEDLKNRSFSHGS